MKTSNQMKKALAIITYARFDYFELVLSSILYQTINNSPLSEFYDIYVFHDGLYNDDSELNRVGHEKITEILDKLPAEIQVVRQTENLAVALHFDFIERFLFVEKTYDFVVFCEDDLILGPGYMRTIDMMAKKFHDDPRVGMISAHPSNPTTRIEEQRVNQDKFAIMGHNWGFGLTRSFWEKRQPLVDCYLDLIRDVPYRKRPKESISNWLKHIGFNPAGSTQDYIKDCATFALGALKLSTYVNLALPIGRTGIHCTSELFKKMNLDKSIMFDQELDKIGDLDNEQFISLYSQGASLVGEKFANSIQDPASFDLIEWQTKLKNGEFHPTRITFKSDESKKTTEFAKKWRASDIPIRPHMEKEGVSFLEERLMKAGVYLEYGAGGSTVMAADLGVKYINSVDSDKGFLNAVRSRVAERQPDAKMTPHYVDIGPTKEWGQPIDRKFAKQWPLYCVTGWDDLNSQNLKPDLILIDGRFRVACFLASLIFSKPDTIILFDDYFDRPHYFLVEKYLRPTARAGRMAEFIINSPFSHSQVLLDLMISSTDPN